MLIKKLIEEMEKELTRGHEEIFLERGGFHYDFDIGMDDKAEPLIILLPKPQVIKDGNNDSSE